MLQTELRSLITQCEDCPRLRSHCQDISVKKRRSYLDQSYWAKPVSGFGDWNARLVIVGLAPGAHGANRTGRVFTGDRSGDWLYQALHQYGFASQPLSSAKDDGLQLMDAYITCIVKCAPPDNRPNPAEIENCRRFLEPELCGTANARIYLALGQLAYHELWRSLVARGLITNQTRPKFKHGLEISLDGHKPITVLLSYHPSQQNTFTGRLTEPLFHSVFQRARQLLSHS